MGKNRFTTNPRKFYKTNLVELLERISPEVYQEEDLALSGTELNPVSQIINTHLQVADNISTVIPLSGVENSQTSSLGNISGISQYFVKQNKLTNITPFLFDTKILLPLGETLANFDTSSEFTSYLSGTLLPKIIPPSLSNDSILQGNITDLSSLTGDSNTSSVHNYLVDALGWMYFLNTSADGGLDYSPSSYVLNSLKSLYLGDTIETVDGIKGLTEYLWKNAETCSFGSYIPTDFISGTADAITESSAGTLPTYTSGTQKLESLKTLIDVVYSPLYLDEQDFTVKTAFDNYIDASLILENRTSKGPHRKFMNLIGYGTADITDEVENIGLIYDIENVKDEHLQYIADLIGFKLRGNSSAKWRHQLRSAISLYKSSGTVAAIQAAINLLIVDSVFDVSGQVNELWESYLPHLIWYALGTESPLFKDLTTWTQSKAFDSKINTYSPSSLEDNLKIVTDSILLDLYRAHSDNFIFNGQRFPVPELWELDINGCKTKRYTIINEPSMKPFHIITPEDAAYTAYKQQAKLLGEGKVWEAAEGFGPLGFGVYMAGFAPPTGGARPTYLRFEGDLNFVFNYRGKNNFPIPPFEEVKFYKNAIVSDDIVASLVERLKCFHVEDSFAEDVGDYIISSTVANDSDLGHLNEFLMFFSSVQVPQNFNEVLLGVSDYEKNLLNLWNGKSSHLFINFKDTDFDFSKTTMEGDGRYALYETSRVAREFAPAHAITQVNLAASAEDDFSTSSAIWDYLGFDKDDTRASYTSAAVLGNFEISGGASLPSFSRGSGGLGTFKREDVDRIGDITHSTNQTTEVPRRALRRRNFKYTLPKEGYYDRTGFNGPTNWDLEAQNPNLISYTFDPTLDPEYTQADPSGAFWLTTSVGSISSIQETNPDGGISSIEVSAVGGSLSWLPYLVAQPNTSSNSFGYYPREKVIKENYKFILSYYVKKPPTGLSPSSFMINLYDDTHPDGSNTFEFEYLGGGNVPTFKDGPVSNSTHTIESVGDDWYRIIGVVSGLGESGNTSYGDEVALWFYLGDVGGYTNFDDLAETRLWIYGMQLEQRRLTESNVPSKYDHVYGVLPDPVDKGSLTLGYVPSAGEFYPILDYVNPSGVWHECETLESTRQFSGITTSATFPYRGLSSLGSNNKAPEIASATPKYIDRGQVPPLYNTMHKLFEAKALDYANEQINLDSITYSADSYWKNNKQSFANEAIASGFVLNSFADYENFSFGTGLHKAYRDYCKYFGQHPLGLNEIEKTGGNIFAHVFGKGLYNCDFELAGSAATQPLLGNFISSSTVGSIPISPSEVFTPYLADASENILEDATQMDAADTAWNYADGASSQPNTHFAPDGSKTAATIVAYGGTINQNLTQDQTITSAKRTPFTHSFYFKKDPSKVGEYIQANLYLGGPALSPQYEAMVVSYWLDSATLRGIDTSITQSPGGFLYTEEDNTKLESVGNDWYRVSITLIDWSGLSEVFRTRYYPKPQSTAGGTPDVSAVLWGAQLVSGTQAITPFNGLGTYIASGLEDSIVPMVGTFIPPFDMASGSYTVAAPHNAEFRNPHILSGVEFIQPSGAPTRSRFSIFKLREKGASLTNSLVKCKSLLGLSRIKFDLSSYGDRPNQFIKDHKFKLNVKSLVAEENSALLGGGKLGVWIHTKPINRRNPNLLSYTDDPGASPGLDWAGGDGQGVYWTGANNETLSFSSIAEINPFGTPSSIALSSKPGSTAYNYMSMMAASTVEANGGSTQGVYLREDFVTLNSIYVKKPDSGALTPSSFFLMVHDINAPDNQTNNVVCEYLGGGSVPTIKNSGTHSSNSGSIEDVGNGWYRITQSIPGLGAGAAGTTVDGDMCEVRYYLGDYDKQVVPNASLWFYGPQLEQYPLNTYQTDIYKKSKEVQALTASPYQVVAKGVPEYGNEINGYMWSWTPEGKWVLHREDELSINKVLSLSHIHDFALKTVDNSDESCLGRKTSSAELLNNLTLNNLKDEYFENTEITFDTRNFTINNNFEYLDIIPVTEEVYKVMEQVNRDDTNYQVEIFFVPNTNPDKYLLLDSVNLTDLTLREHTGVPTGYGIQTSGIPLRPFVQEDKLYLDKDQLRDVFGFYNGLAGQATGLYATTLASKDATITSGTLETSGGSRLNYRIHPSWVPNTTQSSYDNYNTVELDN